MESGFSLFRIKIIYKNFSHQPSNKKHKIKNKKNLSKYDYFTLNLHCQITTISFVISILY